MLLMPLPLVPKLIKVRLFKLFIKRALRADLCTVFSLPDGVRADIPWHILHTFESPDAFSWEKVGKSVKKKINAAAAKKTKNFSFTPGLSREPVWNFLWEFMSTSTVLRCNPPSARPDTDQLRIRRVAQL